MVAYHYSNVILVAPFKIIKYQHRIAAYNSIIQRPKNRSLTIGLQFLDNEASQNYKTTIKDKWGMDFQLIHTGIHRRNAAEQPIRFFKAHFLSVLLGVVPEFPQFLWDLLLMQTEMTFNFIRQSTINRTI